MHSNQVRASSNRKSFFSGRSKCRNAVIVGVNRTSIGFARELQAHVESKLNFTYFVDDRSYERLRNNQDYENENIHQSEVIRGIAQLPGLVTRHRIDVVFVALPLEGNRRVHHLLDRLTNTTASVYILPSIDATELIKLRLMFICGQPAIAIREAPVRGAAGFLKACIDISFTMILLLLCFPIMLLIAALIKCTSPGPVLFKQRRWGLNGKEIVIYKFRTMRTCDDGDQIQQAVRNDPRTTSIGRYLRKSSLDELPQLINVLKGELSLVGPRPHAVAHNKLYAELVQGYMLRYRVKPGITGWAQIHGARGETDTLEKMQQRIAYDIEYIKKWSVWLDLKIIFYTPFALLRARNAY